MNVSAVDLEILRTVEHDRSAGRLKEGDAEVAERAKQRLEDEYRRLAALSPGQYGYERKGAAEALGIPAAALDAEVKERRQKPESGARGHAVKFDEPEPWPEPVDGAELIAEIAGIVQRYVVLPEAAAIAVSLWAPLSWVHDAARISPLLAITSPEKRCGKTTLLEVLGSLVRRPLSASNITAAALFRAVERFEPTLLIDEADTFLRNSDDLRGILNSGHRRRSASIVRNVGDDHEPRQFRTWAPKAIALIGKLPSTLADRSVHVALRRRGPGEAVARWRDESFPELCRKLARWAADHFDELAAARPGLPIGLHDRALDNWEPLLAIADAAGGGWPERARTAARELSGDPDESASTLLLEDVRRIFGQLGADRLASADLCAHLAAMESSPWPEWRHGKPITPRQLARLLARFDIVPTSTRIGDRTPKGYARGQFVDAWARYLAPPEAATTPHASDSAVSSEFKSATRGPSVADANTAELASDGTCGVVADQFALEGDL